MRDNMKKRMNRIKVIFLSVTDEVDNVVSNYAANFLITKLEYISGTIGEMENVL